MNSRTDSSLWLQNLHNGTCGYAVKIKKILLSKSSQFQKIDIYETYDFGNILTLNGCLVYTEKDAYIYNEMMTHPAMNFLSTFDKALIIGGGDGGILNELIKYKNIKSIDIVEIDKQVIEAAQKHLKKAAACFKDKRVNIILDDGSHYLNNTDQKYSLILIDSYYPSGPIRSFQKESFYQNVKNKIKNNGIVLLQSDSPYYAQDLLSKNFSELSALFKQVHCFTAPIETFTGGLCSFLFCSDKYHPLKDFKKTNFDQEKIKTRYYNAGIHEASFRLPNTITKILSHK